MKYKANIDIMTMNEILDPQGKVVTSSLHKLGLSGVADVRIGKHITLMVDAADKTAASEMVDTACKKLLANLIMEKYSFELVEA
ncbi:MAG: phosphoribosylformylglycinamidine synthase subunit PurS [Bacteroidetes bacterium]|nr:phosphoribosylformylglycinamidine synthase subunit PurS [Bacteroidota bacterium]